MARFMRRATMDETCPNSTFVKKVSLINRQREKYQAFSLLGFAIKKEERCLMIDTDLLLI